MIQLEKPIFFNPKDIGKAIIDYLTRLVEQIQQGFNEDNSGGSGQKDFTADIQKLTKSIGNLSSSIDTINTTIGQLQTAIIEKGWFMETDLVVAENTVEVHGGCAVFDLFNYELQVSLHEVLAKSSSGSYPFEFSLFAYGDNVVRWIQWDSTPTSSQAVLDEYGYSYEIKSSLGTTPRHVFAIGLRKKEE